ncbi:MAG: hypothetical protein MUE60_03995 [Candidatus Eisenbacteria bacterium]|jgi:hypothetical protein|nr:hypothetical protein [Candidatus Eisenbacteria bacterium]
MEEKRSLSDWPKKSHSETALKGLGVLARNSEALIHAYCPISFPGAAHRRLVKSEEARNPLSLNEGTIRM